MEYNLQIVLILTVGFALASLLGYIVHRLRMPFILGYLLAGYMIGPYSPGFVANIGVSEQLAEIGVVLMLFSVGLEFNLKDLLRVKKIAIPGAIGQTLVAAVVCALLIHQMEWPIETGIIIGLAIGVASTVVLIRILTEYNLLHTREGHIVVGWLIVEDILTVMVLILLPMLAEFVKGENVTLSTTAEAIAFAFGKFALLVVFLFTVGQRVAAYILTNIARLRSHELFTLTVLALTFGIAIISALVFGTSIALGAFIAGMVVGQTDVRHQAAANALSVKDVFTVVFFLSVGILFNPMAIVEHFHLFILILSVILIIKPLTAFIIVWALGFPSKTASTIAIALAQIGEFSFILSEEAMNLKLLPDEGYDVIVACAILSIALNPILFKWLIVPKPQATAQTTSYPLRHKISKKISKVRHPLFEFQRRDRPRAIVVGFNFIGQALVPQLEGQGYAPLIIERNIDIVTSFKDKQHQIIFGDAAQPNILETALIETAKLLVITLGDFNMTKSIITSAQHLNPRLQIIARITHINEKAFINEGVRFICAEEAIAKAMKEAISRIQVS
jgi:monovalent cation:H+ antiporter-2, CPA2 family